jgi:hypothetical protein
MKKNISKIVLTICLTFVFKITIAQQATGSFITMDGGFEGQPAGQLPNTSSSSLPTATWARSSATGKATVRQINNTGGRSGNNFVSINDTSTTTSTNLLTPNMPTGAIVGGNSYIIQFYYRATDLTTLPNTNINVGLSNASGTGVTQTLWTPNPTTNNAVWLKSVNVVTASTASTAGSGFGVFRVSSGASNNGKAIDVDDWVVYSGNTVDVVPPSNPGNASIVGASGSTLNVTWSAASSVDSGGYLVIRYTADPTTQPDPNVNGVYSIGNSISNGVVAYTGTATSFTDKLLNSNTQYWYRVYTVDKAFNYSNYVVTNGSTNGAVVLSNFYIDATNGNDSNDGSSPATAWKTVSKVNATTFVGGDSVLFKSGEVWTGTTLAPKGSGTSNKRIVISKYGTGSLPRIDADGNGLHNENGVYLFNQEYITISDLEITNNYAATKTDTVVRKGVYVLATNKGTVSCITLRNLVIHDVLGTYDFSNESGGIYCNITGTSTITKFDSLLIEGCKVYNVDKIGISNQSVWDGRDINGDYGSTPWRPSTNYVIRNCEVDSSGGNGMIIRDAKAPLVEYNYLYKCGKRYSGNALFTFGCDDALVQYNESAFTVYNAGDVDASGFDGDYRCKRTIFQYNYSHDNDGGFAVVVCNPGGTPARFDDSTVFRYNISQNDGHFNGGNNNEGQIISVTGQTTNTFIYNNTIYSSNDYNYVVLQRPWGGSGSVYPTNTFYYNNIFYLNKSSANFSFGNSVNTVFDYNLFYQPLGGNHPIDPHSITTNPNLVNPGSGNKGLNTLTGYKLQGTSPCINTGKLIVGAPFKDFFGNAVPTVTTDIGASEFTGTVPITLTMFKAENINTTNRLTWNTFTEINNAYFEIQKSNDGLVFEAIAAVNSQSMNGNSTTPLNYQFIDKKPFEKITYYRLKQVDKNGKFSYSNIISVKSTNKNIGSINVYPNPIVGKEINVNLSSLQKGNYNLTITNAIGQIVSSKQIAIQNSNETNKIVIANNFTAGCYFIKITGNNSDLLQQIIIK